MSKTYFIKLRPTSYFFFGGENKFEAEGVVNYLVRSNYFPQQTSLLGLTRFLLLKASEKEKVEETIGATGFRIQTTDYGIIEQLSPALIYKKDKAYLPLPLSYDKEVEPLSSKSLVRNANKSNISLKVFKEDKEKTKRLLPYTYKDEYVYCSNKWLIGEDGVVEPLEYDEESKKGVFIPHEQVGIKKNIKGVTEDQAFYKLTAYRMAEDFYFAYHLTLKEAHPAFEVGQKQLVTLGGERSQFIMEITAAETSERLNFSDKEIRTEAVDSLSKDQLYKIALISDAYVDMKKLYEHDNVLFVIGKSQHFRFIQTNTNTKNHYKLSKEDKSAASISDRINLLKKGSVIYCKDEAASEAVQKILEAEAAFRTIGYNHFIPFN